MEPATRINISSQSKLHRMDMAIMNVSSRGSDSTNIFPLLIPFAASNTISNNVRLSLLLALSSQAALKAQRNFQSFTSEVIKYVNPRRGEARNLEEALMSVPDLETIPYRVLRREESYEIREVEAYVVAETVMPGTTGFDFYGSSQGFNTLAAYLFGKNLKRDEMEMTTPVLVSRSQSEGEKMEMTTPVLVSRSQSEGEKMDMTTPVISQQTNGGQWKMAFVMPSKYGDDLPLPVDNSVTIRRVPSKVVAVTAFSGYVTDEEVKRREQELRKLLEKDTKLRLRESAQVEVSQFNPPFTLPFMRRNEIALEVSQVDS